MEDIKRKRDPMVNMSKFTYNKKIFNGVVAKLCHYFWVLNKYQPNYVKLIFFFKLKMGKKPK